MYKLVFQNDSFIIVDKEANVLTVPSRFGKNDERDCLGIKLGKDYNCKIMPVHRLDYEVSGLVMFATNKAAQIEANLWFERKQILKTYVALTSKMSEAQELELNKTMEWECLLAKGKKRAYIADFGKKSITFAKLISQDDNVYRFHLNPITGRSHQLRFELYRHHYPILGDTLYSSTEKFSKGIALRSFELDLTKCPGREKFMLPEKFLIKEF